MRIRLLAKLMGFCVTTLLISNNNVYAEEQDLESCKSTTVTLGNLEEQQVNDITRQSLIELSQKYQNLAKDTKNIEEIIGKDTKEKLDVLNSEIISNTKNSSILNARQLTKDANRVLSEVDYKKALDSIKDNISQEEYKNLTELLTNSKLESENISNVAELSDAKLYIFVSWSMGEDALKELIKLTAREQNVSLIFRGVLPNESISQGIKRIHRLLIDEKTEVKEPISFS